MKRVVVLISGRGSNLQALLDARLPGAVSAVLSNNAQARGLALAQARGVPVGIVDHRSFADRLAFEAALSAAIDRHEPHLVVLAGFMRILTSWFVDRYAGRLINIHPSLLPAFAGTDTHRRALEAGVTVHGCTVHFVTAQVDHGPVIVQAAVPVQEDDTPQTLAERVLQQEHKVLPQAVGWFLEERLQVRGNRVQVRGTRPSRGALVCPEEA
jgi:phosphoribosylglycinamide formyltransferase-1